MNVYAEQFLINEVRIVFLSECKSNNQYIYIYIYIRNWVLGELKI